MMIKEISFEESKLELIHKEAIRLSLTFRKTESDLINILQQIDEYKIFYHKGYSSLYMYTIYELKLSEANSLNLITVARKSKEVPELKQAIAEGHITVSKARKITPILTKENSNHWIELATTLSKQELEKEVAKEHPQILTPEITKYVTETRLELRFGVSEELMKKFRRAQDLTSQSNRKAASLEDTLNEVLDLFLIKQDPVEKAKRNLNKVTRELQKEGQRKLVQEKEELPSSRYIPAQVKHGVHSRDQGQCTHKDKNGKRCENQRWLEVHHIVPVSRNGNHTLHNLQTLCAAHHKFLHMND